MNYKRYAFIWSLLVISGAFAADISLGNVEKILSLCDLDQNKIIAIFEGGCPEIAIEFSEGQKLPLKLAVKSEFFSLVHEGRDSYVQIDRPFYLRCIGKDFLMSFDLNDWKVPEDVLTGKISGSINTQNELALTLEAYRR